MRRLARPARAAASRLVTAEARVEAVSRDVEARRALVSEIEALGEEEACRAMVAAKLVALRASEPDARLEEREALALSDRELLRARVKRAEAELEAAAERLLLREWVRAVIESWLEMIQAASAGDRTTSLS